MGTETKQNLDGDLADWRSLETGLRAAFATGNFVTGLEFTNAVGAAAELAGHHPEITLSYPRVEVELISHDVGAVTDRDISLAQTISQLARARGIKCEPRR